MRTTFDINDAILQKLRITAAATRTPLRRVLHEVLQLGLRQLQEPKEKYKFHVDSHDLKMKPAFRSQSMNQLYDQLEAERNAR